MSVSASISERRNSVARAAAAAETAAPPFPRAAKIELVARCDFQCLFCAATRHPRVTGDMSQRDFQRVARGLRRLGVEELGLFYIGESFLCEWLPEAVDYAKRACGFSYVFLTTNGYAASRERVRACMEAGLDSLKFAFNWCGPDQFAAVTGRPAKGFDEVLDNLRAAREVRDSVQRESAHRCGLYASSLTYDSAQAARMAPVLAEIEPLVDEHYWLPVLGHAGPPDAKGCGSIAVKPLPCGALFTVAHVTADLQLSACPLDASPRFHMGDLGVLPFTHAWRSPAFQALREAHLKGDVRGTVCSQCIAYGASR